MKVMFYLITSLLLFASAAIADGYTYTNPDYNDPYYYPPSINEGVVLTPVNPPYQNNPNYYPYPVSPESIITVPNPPPTYPDYPRYPNYPNYPDYSTYPITFDRGADYRSGLSTYYIGENVSLNLTAVDQGNLYLFVIDPNGSIRQLLPNYSTRSSYSYPVTSGRSYRIPEYGARYKLLAVEPRGYHKLIGVLVSSPYSSGNYSHGNYSSGNYSQSDLFNGIYSESSLSSRIDHLRHQNNLKIFRYEGRLLVQ